jgi:RNA polymerase sigma-70 factor (ECF subfamily)
MGRPGTRSDRDLVERFRDGDREAFQELYRAHFPAVLRFAYYMTGDRIVAGEITQDAFIWFVDHPRQFNPERGDLAAFLGGVARKMLLRRQTRERRWLSIDDSATVLPRAQRPAWSENVEREQEADLVRRAVASLPDRYREAVVLCDLEEKSYDEAASIIGCPKGTVRSRLHRAREILGRKFQWKKEGQWCI